MDVTRWDRDAARELGDERGVIGARWRRRALRGDARHRAKTACTSSGSTMSRPASMAQARAARTSPCRRAATAEQTIGALPRAREQRLHVSEHAGATCTAAPRLQLAHAIGFERGCMPASRSRRSPSASSARFVAASG
jgi:hypothetical protein